MTVVTWADERGAPSTTPLSPPPDHSAWLGFDRERLVSVRRMVSKFAINAGFTAARAIDLATAVNEVATNSVMHGGGRGTLRMWKDGSTLLCEVRDAGRYAAGPPASGHGLWLANQLCDLMQVRMLEDGTVVRLHMKPG